MFNLFQSKKQYEIENYALKISLEFGENFGKDISERLLRKIPNLMESEIVNYKELVKNVEKDCWNCADLNGPQINAEQLNEFLIEKIFKKYTWINKQNQSNIFSKFSYYFWKDGLIK